MENIEFMYKEGTLPWESHCHPSFEIIAVLEGTMTLLSEGKQFSLSSDTIILIPPLLYHTVTPDRKCVYRRVTVLFDAQALPSPLSQELAEGCTDIFIFPSALPTEMAKTATGEYYAPLRAAYLTQILYAAIAHSKEKPIQSEIDRTLGEILRYIDEHLEEPLVLSDIAAATARSTSSLCHLFREKMKISVKQYILEKKLALAAKRIRDGVPPTLAASQIGYVNYSNFYRMYRRRFGAPPSQKEK
jgi:AraC-like DNA-binding protein